MGNIPNRVRDMMGILVDVNLKEKEGKSYLEIVTKVYHYILPNASLEVKRINPIAEIYLI